jgi:signal peptidase I
LSKSVIPKSATSRVFAVLVPILAVAAWWLAAPPALGGNTSYVTTHGISMLPRFHTGDLALVRPADSYRVGEIAAYHSATLHTVVLHRIIAVHDGHYTFKGDNNSFTDPDHPVRAQLIGHLWVRIPDGGHVLTKLRSPLGIGLLVVVLLAGLGAFGTTRSAHRRRRRQARATVNMPQPVRFPAGLVRIARAVLATATLAGALAAVLGFTHAETAASTASHPYTATTTFAYRSKVRSGPVYPGGEVLTGDPVFIRLVRVVTFQATRRLADVAVESGLGASSMTGTIFASSGWHHSFTIAPPLPITGADVSRSGTVDLRAVLALAARVGTLTGVPDDSYQLSIVFHTTGSVISRTGRILPDADIQTDTFSFSTTELQPASTTSPVAGAAPLPLIRHYSWVQPIRVASGLTIVGHRISVTWLRRVGLVVFVISGLGLILADLAYRRGGEADRIRRRHAPGLVPVSDLPADRSNKIVEMASFDGLAQIALRYERVILHLHASDRDDYVVRDETTTYHYRAPTTHYRSRKSDHRSRSAKVATAKRGPTVAPPATAAPGPALNGEVTEQLRLMQFNGSGQNPPPNGANRPEAGPPS